MGHRKTFPSQTLLATDSISTEASTRESLKAVSPTAEDLAASSFTVAESALSPLGQKTDGPPTTSGNTDTVSKGYETDTAASAQGTVAI